MKLQLITSLLLSTTLATSIALISRSPPDPHPSPCTSHPIPSLRDFHNAAQSFCETHIRASAPNPPLLPTPVIDPKNPPIMPPLSDKVDFHVRDPANKDAKVTVSAVFEIRGWAPVTRDSCLEGFGVGERKEEGERANVVGGGVCADGGDVFVQGWNQSVWWNDFGVVF